MRYRHRLAGLALVVVAGCNQVRDGFAPVLGDDVTAAEKERFARRIHLDLSGLPATAEQAKGIVDRLDEEGNTAETREAIAAELIGKPEMGSLYLAETESAALSGQSIETAFGLVCGLVRGADVACLSCGDPDPCTCGCPAIQALSAERQAIRDMGADFVAGGDVTTSEVERAIARSQAFVFNGTSPEGITQQMFQAFLARPAEADEVKNARFMTIGSLIPDSPAGLLFHRHGTNYDDLLDIVFESEVYRDAMVVRVFQRYLGRRPSAAELRHFSESLDAERPDMRPVIRAVVSSAEYFGQ
jgi:hypothetical protein